MSHQEINDGSTAGEAAAGEAAAGEAVAGGAVTGGAVAGGAVTGGAVTGGAVTGGAVARGAIAASRHNHNHNHNNINNGHVNDNNTNVSHTSQQIIVEEGVKGTVITVNRLKHYSFIKRKDDVQSCDIFAREVSIINCQNQKKFFIHDSCKFDIIKTRRGLEAININITQRHIDSISKLPKIPKKQKENEHTQISTDFFKQTIYNT